MLTLDLRTWPQIVDFLHHQLKSQRKQCGVRFLGTPAGKKEMNDHLDMDFRMSVRVIAGAASQELRCV